jgi:hypothetical protein
VLLSVIERYWDRDINFGGGDFFSNGRNFFAAPRSNKEEAVSPTRFLPLDPSAEVRRFSQPPIGN